MLWWLEKVRQSEKVISFSAGEEEQTKLTAVFEIGAARICDQVDPSFKRRGLTTQATEGVPMVRSRQGLGNFTSTGK
jgi:hypothetical protein